MRALAGAGFKSTSIREYHGRANQISSSRAQALLRDRYRKANAVNQGAFPANKMMSNSRH